MAWILLMAATPLIIIGVLVWLRLTDRIGGYGDEDDEIKASKKAKK